jgi:three-Cys-motif partner protein
VPTEYDEIGIWSEVKLAIIKEYLPAYTRIMDATRRNSIPRLHWIYVDGYAGPGYHLPRTTGNKIEGSPLIALGTNPPFSEYHFIDKNETRATGLKQLAGDRADVFTYPKECDQVLLKEVFPRTRYEDYGRAVCVLDPYNMDLSWEVLQTAGKMGSIELFVNLMIMDINRNALTRDPAKAREEKVQQMTRTWGDDTWLDVGYDRNEDLFGEVHTTKVSNSRFAEAFRQRLINVAGFKYVPKPMPMKNSTNAVIYYLYFAGHKTAASNIVTSIFNKYRERQGL